MPANCTFVVLSASGRVFSLSAGCDRDYFKLLLDIAATVGSGGGGQDPPRTLLCNGAIVVPNGLLSLALAYANDRTTAIAQAEAVARAHHTPAWLPEA